MPSHSPAEILFPLLWQTLAEGFPAPTPEYRFAPPRRWRFDFCWPEQKVAAELEGATFAYGRHTRGTGYAADCEKYNMATELGWRVLRYPTNVAFDDPQAMIAQILRVLNQP